jgi:putative chitinase
MSTKEDILLKTAIEAGSPSPRELANFMAQVSHESGNLNRLEENFNYRDADRVMSVVTSTRRFGHDAVQSAVNEARNGNPERLAEMMYGGRMGNNEPGDGWKYHGRGFIQLTGKANYEEAARRTGIDLVNHPELAATPEIAAKIAVDYWQNRVPQNARENVTAATRAVNGGTNGLEDRIEKFEHYQRKLTPEYLERLQQNPSLTTPDLQNQPRPFSNPDDYGSLEVPSRYAALHNQVDGHIKQLYTEKGVNWGDGGDNTVAACTVECVKQKVTDVQHASVGNGNIHLGQKMGYEWNVASIDAVQAARTPQLESFAQLAALDLQQSLQQDNPTQQQTQARKGPSMG